MKNGISKNECFSEVFTALVARLARDGCHKKCRRNHRINLNFRTVSMTINKKGMGVYFVFKVCGSL